MLCKSSRHPGSCKTLNSNYDGTQLTGIVIFGYIQLLFGIFLLAKSLAKETKRISGPLNEVVLEMNRTKSKKKFDKM
jgi:hypothetical protein